MAYRWSLKKFITKDTDLMNLKTTFSTVPTETIVTDLCAGRKQYCFDLWMHYTTGAGALIMFCVSKELTKKVRCKVAL